MSSVVLRAMPTGQTGSTEYNDVHSVLGGLKGARIRFVGYDGVRLDPVGGASLGTGEYAVHIQSAASGGPALAVLHSGTANGATVAPTAANAVFLARDDYVAVGLGKQLRIYETAGTDYAQLSSADGLMSLSGSGTDAGSIALGATPSTTGAIRMTNNTGMYFRNAANSANVLGVLMDGSNDLYLGSAASTSNTIARAATSILLRVGAADVIQVNGTGAIIGTAALQVGFYGSAGAAKPAAYTQTYSTADRTHANPIATALTDAFGAADGTVADVGLVFNQGILNDNFQEMSTKVNQLILDVADVKGLLNSVIDDLQSFGLVP